MHKNDHIAQKVSRGDKKAFEELFFYLYPVMCNAARKFVGSESASKDIAQEAFVRLWSRRKDFDNTLAIKSFLYITVRNLCLNHIRDNKKLTPVGIEITDDQDADLKSVIIEEETVRILYKAINLLPPQSSRIIMLAIKGSKNQEIADTLGISVNTVKTLKYNAIRTLRKELSSYAPSAWVLLLLLLGR